MTLSAIFKAAHKTAKATRNQFNSYRAAFSVALKAQYQASKVTTLTPTQAVAKIQAMTATYTTLTANYWAKAGKERIYIDVHFKSFKKRGAGFIDASNMQLKAPACGNFTSEIQAIFDEIATWKIDWSGVRPVNTMLEYCKAERLDYDIEVATGFYSL